MTGASAGFGEALCVALCQAEPRLILAKSIACRGATGAQAKPGGLILSARRKDELERVRSGPRLPRLLALEDSILASRLGTEAKMLGAASRCEDRSKGPTTTLLANPQRSCAHESEVLPLDLSDLSRLQPAAEQAKGASSHGLWAEGLIP